MACPLLAGMTATCAGARSSKEQGSVCVCVCVCVLGGWLEDREVREEWVCERR